MQNIESNEKFVIEEVLREEEIGFMNQKIF